MVAVIRDVRNKLLELAGTSQAQGWECVLVRTSICWSHLRSMQWLLSGAGQWNHGSGSGRELMHPRGRQGGTPRNKNDNTNDVRRLTLSHAKCRVAAYSWHQMEPMVSEWPRRHHTLLHPRSSSLRLPQMAEMYGIPVDVISYEETAMVSERATASHIIF